MKISKVDQITLGELHKPDIDVVIVASGYESRARALASNPFISSLPNSCQKVCWGFEEYADDPVRVKNDSVLYRLGFKKNTCSGNDGKIAEEFITNLLLNHDRSLGILIDISSMTRSWYAAIVRALSVSKYTYPVRTIFTYTPSVWKHNSNIVAPNEILGPVSGFAAHALPSKPTALVIGLGIDDDRALGLKDYLDPIKTICFYSDPSVDERYTKSILSANKNLLCMIPAENRYTYDIFDTFASFTILKSVCQGLCRDYCVVLASLGPKMFGLYNFLLYTTIPDISVWRVSPADRQPPFDHKPQLHQILFDVQWS